MNPLSHRPFLGGTLALMAACLITGRMHGSESSLNWTSWRGPNDNGSVTGGQYPTTWGTNLTWKVRLPGKGTSTPIVYKDRLYLTCPSEGQDTIQAYDFNGKLLWEARIGRESAPRHRTLASSCNASPVTDGTAIYAHFRSGHLAAVDLEGQIKWKINLVEQFGAENLFWDTGASPVVTERYVIMPRVHSGESWIAAFDKATGELRWKTARNYRVPNENDNGYTTPLILRQGQTTSLLLWGAEHLTVYNEQDGSLLWWAGGFNPEKTGFWPHIATPVVVGDIAVVPVGRDDRNSGRLHGIRLGGSGDVSSTHRVWDRTDTGIFVATPAVHKGLVYLLRHRGQVVCLNPADGKTVWTGAFPEHRSPYYASPVIANGILYAAREDGVVFAARVEDRFEILSENPLAERIIATPVPASNRLFFRGDHHLFCVQATEKQP